MSCRTDTVSPDCTIDVSDKLKCDASIIIDKLSHLSVDQSADILAVIDDFAVCFSRQSGLYTGIEHCIETTPEQWATIEREAYAIVWALDRFRDLVLGHHITVYCDHNPLQYIKESATKSANLLRRALALQEYSIEVKYTPGHLNVFADLLSRLE